ncbi:hypothetical protein IFM89_016801 [Coptis chinensis]|uniref:Uncharacterized protein n=1 Tax=Coptis chinensis TaxID=261450 RepID=A0A835IWV1_9MAGN|nr:hypothetical protein IFM89_016801 [Coptis chinensis]
MSQTGSDQPSDYQLDSEPSDSEEIEEQHESKMARMHCAPPYADCPTVLDDIKKHGFKRVTESVYSIISLLPCLNAMPIPCATAHSSTDEPLLVSITSPVSLRSAAAHLPNDPYNCETHNVS